MELRDTEEATGPMSSDVGHRTKNTERFYIAHIAEPENVFSRGWIKHQFRTFNVINFALLIILIIVIDSTSRRQESQNAIATQTLVQSQRILEDSSARFAKIEADLQALNSTLQIAYIQIATQSQDVNNSYIAAKQDLALSVAAFNQEVATSNLSLSNTIAQFYDQIARMRINDSLASIQTQTMAIAGDLQTLNSTLQTGYAQIATQSQDFNNSYIVAKQDLALSIAASNLTLSSTIAQFYDQTARMHINDSLAFIQTQTMAIEALQNLTSTLDRTMNVTASLTQDFFGAWKTYYPTTLQPGGGACDIIPYYFNYQKVGSRCFFNAAFGMGIYTVGTGGGPIYISLPPECEPAPSKDQLFGTYAIGVYSSLPNYRLMHGALAVPQDSPFQGYAKLVKYSYYDILSSDISAGFSVHVYLQGSIEVVTTP